MEENKNKAPEAPEIGDEKLDSVAGGMSFYRPLRKCDHCGADFAAMFSRTVEADGRFLVVCPNCAQKLAKN